MRKKMLLVVNSIVGAVSCTASQATDVVPVTTKADKIAVVVAAIAETKPLPPGFAYRLGSMMPGANATYTVGTDTGAVIVITRMEAATAPKGDPDLILRSLLPSLQARDGFVAASTGHDTAGGAALTYVEGDNPKSRGEKAIHGALRTVGGAVIEIDSTATLGVTKQYLATIKSWK